MAAFFSTRRRKYFTKTSMPCASTSLLKISMSMLTPEMALTHLPYLLGLCVPLGAILLVLQGNELAQQQGNLRNDNI